MFSTRNCVLETITKISIISLFLETQETKSARIRRGGVKPRFRSFRSLKGSNKEFNRRLRTRIGEVEQPSIFYLFPGNEFSPRWSMRKLRNEVSNEGFGRISRIRYILLHEERIRIHFWKWSKPRCRPTSSSSYLQLSKTLHPTSASTYPFVSISYSCLVPPPLFSSEISSPGPLTKVNTWWKSKF